MNRFRIGVTVKITLEHYDHYGIVTGQNKITHNSKRLGGVVESTFEEFSVGNVNSIMEHREITSENLFLAAHKAKMHIGQSYDLFTDNCEHFVRMVHGLKETSPQMKRAAITLASGLVEVFTGDPKLKAICRGIRQGAQITERGEDPTINATFGGLLNYFQQDMIEDYENLKED